MLSKIKMATLQKAAHAPMAVQTSTALSVHERLAALYGTPVPFFSNKDPISELISSLLSHRTRNRDSGNAYKVLRAKFPTWAQVRDAPVAEVEAAIEGVRWPEQKAPRIQEALRYISEKRGGELSLDFLAEMMVEEAREWLEQIPGVGPKTSAATLLFSTLRMAALPVDSHHQRVAERVGLIPLKLSNQKVHELLAAQLPDSWDAQQLYDNHELLMFHGQRVCHYNHPVCSSCVLLHLCHYGQQRI